MNYPPFTPPSRLSFRARRPYGQHRPPGGGVRGARTSALPRPPVDRLPDRFRRPGRRGWADALRTAGLDLAERTAIRAAFTTEGGIRGADHLLRSTHGSSPPALVASTDAQARGVIAAAGRQGLRVPDDLAITSVDGTLEVAFSNPPLTSVQQPFVRLADVAITALLDADPADEAHVLVESGLRIRRSCGCPAPTAAEEPAGAEEPISTHAREDHGVHLTR
ncbi:substrate-binding domain-containing protein [Streptomyces sp. NPDC059477]|uniref:substrate-binding domain-containing protein n=1 Tax=Streptomyces sp. NPDC059477 TaxID=3346847 RepID=UPI003699E014